jgi:membrane protein implicated in regulation of membrane protease activity
MEIYLPYFWLALVIISAIAEAATAGLVSVWFIPGSLAALVLSLFRLPLWSQIVAFVVISILGIFLLRTRFRGILHPKVMKTNVDAIIGARGVVSERIDNLAGCGQVKVNGQIWSARAMEPDRIFDEGEVVTVIAIEGVKLICK